MGNYHNENHFANYAGLSVWNFAGWAQVEAVALLTRRVQAYLEIADTLASCNHSDDVMREQVRFWQIAQRNYVESVTAIVGASTHDGSVRPSSLMNTERARDYIVMDASDNSAVQSAVVPITTTPTSKTNSRDHQMLVRKSA